MCVCMSVCMCVCVCVTSAHDCCIIALINCRRLKKTQYHFYQRQLFATWPTIDRFSTNESNNFCLDERTVKHRNNKQWFSSRVKKTHETAVPATLPGSYRTYGRCGFRCWPCLSQRQNVQNLEFMSVEVSEWVKFNAPPARNFWGKMHGWSFIACILCMLGI